MKLIRFGVFPILGAWLGCNAIIGLERGEGSGGAAGGEPGSGGAAGGEPTTSSSTTSSSVNGQGGATGAGGMGTGGACIGCFEVLNQGPESLLCTMNGPPSSEVLFQMYLDCVCMTSCEVECGDNFCQQGSNSQECNACISSECSSQNTACHDDKMP